MPSRATIELSVLIAAILADGAVMLYVESPMARLVLGLLLLAIIVWSSARVGVMDLVTRTPVERIHRRRFVRLRGQVQQLLDEIRRLNWMAVDVERGFRSRQKALSEMDAIVDRLRYLVEDIRGTAGQMSDESEAGGEAEGQE